MRTFPTVRTDRTGNRKKHKSYSMINIDVIETRSTSFLMETQDILHHTICYRRVQKKIENNVNLPHKHVFQNHTWSKMLRSREEKRERERERERND